MQNKITQQGITAMYQVTCYINNITRTIMPQYHNKNHTASEVGRRFLKNCQQKVKTAFFIGNQVKSDKCRYPNQAIGTFFILS